MLISMLVLPALMVGGMGVHELIGEHSPLLPSYRIMKSPDVP